jgi:hypothetical protein
LVPPVLSTLRQQTFIRQINFRKGMPCGGAGAVPMALSSVEDE